MPNKVFSLIEDISAYIRQKSWLPHFKHWDEFGTHFFSMYFGRPHKIGIFQTKYLLLRVCY